MYMYEYCIITLSTVHALVPYIETQQGQGDQLLIKNSLLSGSPSSGKRF